MKLDPKCVRDILMVCEDANSLTENLKWSPLSLSVFSERLTEYKKNEIAYTLILLNEAKYIEAHVSEYDGGIANIIVYKLTYTGHELIDTIRPKSVWNSLSKTISEISHVSLPVLQQLGSHFLINSLTH